VKTTRIPYFDFYPSDFMGGVRGLTPAEVGIYTMILCRIYEENGPVEHHVTRLAAYCNCPVSMIERVVARLVDLGKITLADGALTNPRAEAEIAKRQTKLNSSVKAGKISAEKRQEKQREAATPVERTVNHTDTYTDKKEEIGKPISGRTAEVPVRFEEFWEAYPHRGGSKRKRSTAEAKYAAAVRSGVPEQTIIDGAMRARGDPEVVRGYARDPVTWINQKGWNDEIQPYPPENPKGPKDGWTNAWQSALADARVADRQGDGSVVPLLHPGNRSGGGEGASGGLVRYPVGRAAGGH
jgi:uncharacterized protein YdaU (DUF1376 family)